MQAQAEEAKHEEELTKMQKMHSNEPASLEESLSKTDEHSATLQGKVFEEGERNTELVEALHSE